MGAHILFQDNDLAVVYKPAGVTVNRADTTKGEETLQDFTEKTLNIVSPEVLPEKISPDGTYNPDFEFFTRGGIVHRLDKETSGIILVAKTPLAFGKLKEQFMGRSVKKTYVALAHGEVLPHEGLIDAPVGRLPYNRTHFGVLAGGREAQTYYWVRGVYVKSDIGKSGKQTSNEKFSFVELAPQTGRTHQIRVHLKHIGHPLFADELYAGRKTARDDRVSLPRLFLHAAGITFMHPITGKEMKFEAPLPQELQSFLQTLTQVN